MPRQHFRITELSVITVTVIACLGGWSGAGTGEPVLAASPRIGAPSTIAGTVTFHGCAVAPEDVQIRARPVTDGSGVGTEIGQRSLNARPIVVNVHAAVPGTFEFALDDAVPLTPYRIGVKLLGQSLLNCGRLVWEANEDALTLAGGVPINLVAHAVHSRLSVLGPAHKERGRSDALWVGADTVDFDTPALATRRFRWRPLDPRVTGGRLQVSTRPFPRVGGRRAFDPCSEDRSAIAFEQDTTIAPGGAADFVVDFHAIVNGGRLIDPGPGIASGVEVGTSAIDVHARTQINLGRPLYVRVLSTVGGEPDCDSRNGVPAEVLIAKKIAKLVEQLGEPQFEIRQVWYNPPYIGPRPKNNGETCYRVTADHLLPFSALKWTAWDHLVISYGKVAKVGSQFMATSAFPDNMFCVPPAKNDDGWFESFVSDFGAVVTGFIDGIAQLVNASSVMWEKIQDYAVDAVAAGLDGVVGCPQWCRDALEAGLEIGLATMGVPPSLPNFDELVDQGADYLAAQVASQVGAPDFVADWASDEAQKFIKKAVKNMQDRPYGLPGLPDWLTADIQFEPASLILDLNRRYDHITFPSRPGLIFDNDPIYAGRFVQLPSKLPGPSQPSLRYPVVLDANLVGLPSAPNSKCTPETIKKLQNNWWTATLVSSICGVSAYEAAVWDKNHWTTLRFKNGCYHFRLTGLSPVGDHVFVLRDQFFRTEDPSKGCTVK